MLIFNSSAYDYLHGTRLPSDQHHHARKTLSIIRQRVISQQFDYVQRTCETNKTSLFEICNVCQNRGHYLRVKLTTFLVEDITYRSQTSSRSTKGIQDRDVVRTQYTYIYIYTLFSSLLFFVRDLVFSFTLLLLVFSTQCQYYCYLYYYNIITVLLLYIPV